MDLVQQIELAVLVLGLLGSVLFIARTRGLVSFSIPARSGGPRRMQVIEKLSLTPSHSLHIVKVDDRVILVGVAPGSCHLLETRETQA